MIVCNSAAASHGNFYRESYCAAMERALKPVLKEIGINVVAKVSRIDNRFVEIGAIVFLTTFYLFISSVVCAIF